MNLENYMQV